MSKSTGDRKSPCQSYVLASRFCGLLSLLCIEAGVAPPQSLKPDCENRFDKKAKTYVEMVGLGYALFEGIVATLYSRPVYGFAGSDIGGTVAASRTLASPNLEAQFAKTVLEALVQSRMPAYDSLVRVFDAATVYGTTIFGPKGKYRRLPLSDTFLTYGRGAASSPQSRAADAIELSVEITFTPGAIQATDDGAEPRMMKNVQRIMGQTFQTRTTAESVSQKKGPLNAAEMPIAVDALSDLYGMERDACKAWIRENPNDARFVVGAFIKNRNYARNAARDRRSTGPGDFAEMLKDTLIAAATVPESAVLESVIPDADNAASTSGEDLDAAAKIIADVYEITPKSAREWIEKHPTPARRLVHCFEHNPAYFRRVAAADKELFRIWQKEAPKMIGDILNNLTAENFWEIDPLRRAGLLLFHLPIRSASYQQGFSLAREAASNGKQSHSPALRAAAQMIAEQLDPRPRQDFLIGWNDAVFVMQSLRPPDMSPYGAIADSRKTGHFSERFFGKGTGPYPEPFGDGTGTIFPDRPGPGDPEQPAPGLALPLRNLYELTTAFVMETPHVGTTGQFFTPSRKAVGDALTNALHALRLFYGPDYDPNGNGNVSPSAPSESTQSSPDDRPPGAWPTASEEPGIEQFRAYMSSLYERLHVFLESPYDGERLEELQQAMSDTRHLLRRAYGLTYDPWNDGNRRTTGDNPPPAVKTFYSIDPDQMFRVGQEWGVSLDALAGYRAEYGEGHITFAHFCAAISALIHAAKQCHAILPNGSRCENQRIKWLTVCQMHANSRPADPTEPLAAAVASDVSEIFDITGTEAQSLTHDYRYGKIDLDEFRKRLRELAGKSEEGLSDEAITVAIVSTVDNLNRRRDEDAAAKNAAAVRGETLPPSAPMMTEPATEEEKQEAHQHGQNNPYPDEASPLHDVPPAGESAAEEPPLPPVTRVFDSPEGQALTALRQSGEMSEQAYQEAIDGLVQRTGAAEQVVDEFIEKAHRERQMRGGFIVVSVENRTDAAESGDEPTTPETPAEGNQFMANDTTVIIAGEPLPDGRIIEQDRATVQPGETVKRTERGIERIPDAVSGAGYIDYGNPKGGVIPAPTEPPTTEPEIPGDDAPPAEAAPDAPEDAPSSEPAPPAPEPTPEG